MRRRNLICLCLCLALALPWGGALADALDVPAAAAPQANALELDGALDSALLPDAPALEDLPPLNAGEDALTLDAELVAGEEPEAGGADGASAKTVSNGEWYGDFLMTGTRLDGYGGEGGEVTVPQGVTEIGGGFYSNTGSKKITSLILPDTCRKINDRAFSGMNIESISLPNSLVYIGRQAFEYCDKLKSVVIPSSVSSIEADTFNGCESLTSVTIPDSVIKLGDRAFQGCASLASVTIPGSISYVGPYAFAGCLSLASATLCEGVEHVEDHAFKNCTMLSSVSLPKSLITLDVYCFEGCSCLTQVVIPEGVSYIPTGAFKNCTMLSSVTIPDSVTAIYNDAFYNCVNLRSVNGDGKVALSDKVTFIDSYAFNGCTSITELSVGKGIKEIKGYAFSGCTRLKKVAIWGHGNGFQYSAFTDIDRTPHFDLYCDNSLAGWCKEQSEKDSNFTYSVTHHYVDLPAVKPTTTAPGKTAGVQCEWCKKWKTEQKDIPKLPKKVSLNYSGSVSLTLGDKLTLVATLTDYDSASTLTWKSSKPAVASVSQKGVVKALKKGSTTITVTTKNKKTAKVTVKVVAPKPTKIKIVKPKSKTVVKGKTLQLKAQLYPANAESKLSWSSSDKSVATVTSKGLVKGVKAGKATITVTTDNGYSASIVVTVKAK